MTEMARGRGLTGRIVSFNAAVGLGEVETAAGERHRFHCVEIADGTRDIALGTEVSFDLLHKFGQAEASNIRS